MRSIIPGRTDLFIFSAERISGLFLKRPHLNPDCRDMSEEPEIHLPRVKLGNQGLEVSKLGFGCAGLTGRYHDPLPEEVGIEVIKDAFNKGITFFDTADVYGANANEILVGKAIKQLPRDKIQLATKFGIVGASPSGMQINGTPEYARKCCEASLKRLDADYIDLYYQHRVDKSVPIEDTMEELKKLVAEGKIKYIGLSEEGHMLFIPSQQYKWNGLCGLGILKKR